MSHGRRSHRRRRFPAEFIQHAIWVYLRFTFTRAVETGQSAKRHPSVASMTSPARGARDRKFADSPLEGNGLEISVPRKIGSDFEASVGLRPIDRRRGSIIRAVVSLGKRIELFRRF
jgi:hypothetical protein